MTVEATGLETPMHRNDIGQFWKIITLDDDREVGFAKFTKLNFGRQYYMIRTCNHASQVIQDMQISEEALKMVVYMFMEEKNYEIGIDID